LEGKDKQLRQLEKLSDGHAKQLLNAKKELFAAQKEFETFRDKVFGAQGSSELDEGYDSDARMQDLEIENMELRVHQGTLDGKG
jgi:hypothetical protein